MTRLNAMEVEVAALLLRSPFETYTVYGLAKKLDKYVSQVQKAVKVLQRLKVVSVKKIGPRTSNCTLDLSTADTDILAISSLHAKGLLLERKLKIRVISKEIEKALAGSVYIMALFGSYAKGAETSRSDVDLCIIIQDEREVQKFKSRVRTALEGFSYRVHVNVFTADWFYEMLKKKGTVGREVLKASVVLHGHDSYYRLVKRYDQEAGYP
ncbi:MAG: nucleotidyltransferase domain-containing protein [Nanoarchaeota archaeon]|nr:nucleotidyltransferase domain-containing protein [Nanoarchaeota archaeon]